MDLHTDPKQFRYGRNNHIWLQEVSFPVIISLRSTRLHVIPGSTQLPTTVVTQKLVHSIETKTDTATDTAALQVQPELTLLRGQPKRPLRSLTCSLYCTLQVRAKRL